MFRKILALVLTLALLSGMTLSLGAAEEGVPALAEAGDAEAGASVPDEPAGDAATGEVPAEDDPAGEEPSEDIPSGDEPAEDAPVGNTPSEDIPSGDEDAGDIPAGDIPTEDEPALDEPGEELPPEDESAADAPDGDIPTGEEAARQGVITAILDGDLTEGVAPVVLSGNDPEPLYIRMLELRSLRASALTPDGVEETLHLQVDWDLTRLSTDLSVPGQYSESAPILAPEGYRFAEGVPSAVVIPVIVQEAVPEVIAFFDDIGQSCAFAIRQGEDWETFFEEQFSDDRWLYAWTCHTMSGETLWAHIRWQNPHADTGVPGEVVVSGRAVLPEGCVLAEGMELPVTQASVSIQSAKRPSLHSWYMSFGNINIPWIGGENGEDESLTLLLRQDSGEWFASDALEYNGESMVVYLPGLEEGHSYQVKAQWSGGETGAFCFDWDGELRNVRYYEGDRDGGDSEGNKQETVIQPSPSRDKDEGELFYEESGDDYSLISGMRLLMMQESGNVTFSKQGVTLTLSKAALDALEIREDSRFLIRLCRTERGFTFDVELDGAPVAKLPDTQVFIPNDAHDGRGLFLLLGGGGISVSSSTACATGAPGFSVHAPGEYFLYGIELPLWSPAEASGVEELARMFAAWCMGLVGAWML